MSDTQKLTFFGRLVRESAHAVPASRRFLCFGTLAPDDSVAGVPLGADGDSARSAPAKRSPVLVRDERRCIPFAHSGMYISVCVERGALRAGLSAAHDWRDYEYDVLYLRRVLVATSMRAVDWRRACSRASVDEAMKRARESESRERGQQKAVSVFPLQANERALVSTLTSAAKAHSMCVADGMIPETASEQRRELHARYATFHGALHLRHSDVAESIGALRLGAQSAAQASLRDLDELGRLLHEFGGAPPHDKTAAAPRRGRPKKRAVAPPALPLVFFGAAVPLPPECAERRGVLARWPGAQVQQLTKKQCATLVNGNDGGGGADNALSQAKAQSVLSVAVDMHRFLCNKRNATSDERWCDTVFGAKSLARYVLRRNNAEGGATFGAHSGDEAVEFLLRERVWRAAYGQSGGARLTLARESGDASPLVHFDSEQYCCTTRDWAAESALARSLLALRPLLVDVGTDESVYGAAQRQQLESFLIDARVLVAGNDALDVLWLTAGVGGARAALAPVDVLYAHARHDTDADRCALELLSYDAVVICDAQRMSRAELALACNALLRVAEQRADVAGGHVPLSVALLGTVSAAHGRDAFTHAHRSRALRALRYGAAAPDVRSLSLALSASDDDDDDAARNVSFERAQVDWLRLALHNAADDAVWRAQLVEQMFGARSDARRALCVLPLVSQAAERFDSALVDGERCYGTSRWLLLAERHDALSETWAALADALATHPAPHLTALAAQLRRMADAGAAQARSVSESVVLFAAPFVGYRRRAARVTGAWLASARLERTQTHFERDVRQVHVDARADGTCALDLDDPRLLIELGGDNDMDDASAGEFDDIDHRVCCRTWSARVAHVAVHRAQLRAQSFVLARDALPLDERSTELVACAPLGAADSAFCYDDMYAAFVDACGPRTEKLALAGVSRARAPALLAARRRVPQQQLERLLRTTSE